MADSTNISSILKGLSRSLSEFSKMNMLPEDANAPLENVASLQQQGVGGETYDDLYQNLSNFSFAKTNYTKYDVLGNSLGSDIGNLFLDTGLSAASGAMSGGGTGAAINGISTALGGAAGLISKHRKASNIAKQANRLALITNRQNLANLDNEKNNVMANTRNQALINLAFGGDLYTDDTFSNGVRFIEEGGSHEQNPFGGVLQGIAADGLPNLVEEGEVIYNDYVYSKRLSVPTKDKEALGLKKHKDYTYAEAADAIQKESEERPNDPLSKKNLEVMMSRLQGSQEEVKAKRDQRKFREVINKMTPDELAMFMQQLQYPEQMQPMMAMQSMQPMQPTQSEVPMFAKGGLLGHKYSGELTSPSYLYPTVKGLSVDSIPVNINSDILKNTYASTADPTVYFSNEDYDTESEGSSSLSQYLRAVPAIGSVGAAIASLFDTPNYENIRRAENKMLRVPRVGTRTIGERMPYRPIDINYLMNRINNRSLGARRAAQEYSAGNRTAAAAQMAAADYAATTGLGEALIQAKQYNDNLLNQILTFNRGTSSFNAEQGAKTDQLNQALDMAKANFLLQTGQLRDKEAAVVQANKSAQITNALNQIGNLGTDMLNREMVKANADSGVYSVLNEIMKNLANGSLATIGAKGGKLNTKKGGKHA